MLEKLIEFLSAFGPFVSVMVLSVLPFVDSKVAVPVGVSTAIWGEQALTIFQSTFVCFVCSTIVGIGVVVFLFFVTKKLKTKKSKFFKKHFFKTKQRLGKVLNKYQNKKTIKKFLFATFFLSLPIPMAGLYSGILVCMLLRFELWQSILCVVLGNLLDAIFLFLFCTIFKSYLNLILCVALILLMLYVFYKLIEFVLKWQPKQAKKAQKTHK